ncbi:molybdopterin molybdotransferase MoeA [Mucilaginibacter sp. RS28]|uniref:Molybdopterin molybdenumtransferase n=1 Tax=Mucilaginibacter straminoryzae TaxID=2932774 RepID=A0A9X1X7F6_9SPHI|nr:molybdopterin molybdotransferase MoeA [Mucilaginibacter straminoryzae]MCJ8210049.1 molybdopterin molybdotransferase MoeA [Mucilaginibacter straminoryzae]
MISVEEARQLIAATTVDFGIEEVGLLQCLGRVLAQVVLADRDYPPFNRVTMDGVAILSSRFGSGQCVFPVEGIQAAGSAQLTLHDANNCLEVMTGAMLPKGCDAVIPYEQIEIKDGIAKLLTEEVKPLQNVHLQGTDSKAGQKLLSPGAIITPAVVGLLAASGLNKVQVKRLPKVAVCATGDELVEIDETPLPHQIRQSNSYMLLSTLQAENISASRHHLTDDPAAMKDQLREIIASNNVVLLSGAVSKGKFDYLPQVLNGLGFETIFHGIAQRPGKPFLFGKIKNGPVVFGFPGNPVSTFVCYHLYFKPWLHQSIGKEHQPLKAFLGRPVTFKPNLAYHALVQLSYPEGRVIASPVDTSTSGDMVMLAQAQGILTLPAGRDEFGTDEAFELTLV